MLQEEAWSSGVTGNLEFYEGVKAAMPADNPSLLISLVTLDGSNYLVGSCSCKLFIKAQGLEDYITGVKVKKPTFDDISARKWELENSLVISWLINLM